jgi:ribosome-binding factor A
MRIERLKQIESMIKQKIDVIIRSEFDDPRMSLMSIVDINLSKELDFVDIYISHPGDEETRKSVLNILVKASGFIEKNLARSTRLRKVPKLRFVLDDSLIKAARIEELLNTLNKDKKPEDKDTANKDENSEA